MSNGHFNKVVMIKTKNVGLAALLASVFGPLGMLYSTTLGAIVMSLLYIVIGLLTFGLGILFLQPICTIWAAVHAHSYNKKLLSDPNEVLGQKSDVSVPVQKPQKGEPVPQVGQSVTDKANQTHGERRPGVVESAMVKGLISQALQLESEKEKDSSEQARLLWEEALKIGGLSDSEELNCHFHLGSFYFDRGIIQEGAKHYQEVAVKDPNLNLLGATNEAKKSMLICDLYTRLSVGWQSLARNEKENRGLKAAIDYLQAKVNILGLKAAPSVLFELGSYFHLYGNRENARTILKRALEAPTYGSDFQEDAKKCTADYLHSMEVEDRSRISRGVRIKTDQPSLTESPQSRQRPAGHRHGKLILLWAFLGCAAIGIVVLIAWPSEFNKHFETARTLFRQGNYAASLESVYLAKEHKKNPELLAFEGEVFKKIREIKEREEAEQRRREYQEYYRRAADSLANGRYGEAKRFSQLASSRMNTRELMSLDSQIDAKMRDARLREEGEKDDAAFASAVLGNSPTSLNNYIQQYPNGKHSVEARGKLSDLRRVELENQESQRRQMQALEVQRQQNAANLRRRAQEERQAQVAADLQNRFNEKIAALRDGCIVRVPHNFTQSSKYRGKIGVFIKLQTMGDKYVLTIKEMKGQRYAWETPDPNDTLDQIVQAVRKRKQFDVTFSKEDLMNLEILALDEKSFKDNR